MATNAELVASATAQLEELWVSIDTSLLEAIAAKIPKTSVDATLISLQDSELDYVVNNFMKEKLGESDAAAGRAKLDDIMSKLNTLSTKNRKQRATAYYLLVKEYGKEAIYS